MDLTSCGAHLVILITGRGNVVGNAVAPCIKLTGNSETYKRMEEDMDFDAGPVLEGTATYAHTIDDGALEVNTTGVEVNTAWMLMPQTLDTNAKINVVYDIYEKDVLLDTVTSAIDLNDTQAWGEGKKIRYTLTLANKAAKVTFVPEVGPWSTADDTNVEK